MKQEDQDKLFRELADSFIDVGNKHCDREIEINMISSAFLYGASRFGAFVAASQSEDLHQYEANRNATIEYFLKQFRSMLEENLDDYKRVFNEDLKYSHLMKDPN